MKAIHCYIRQSLAEHVIAELMAAGCHTISVIDVRGIGDEQVEDLDYSIALAQRIEHVAKLEIVASDDDAERWALLIGRHARTGRPGDGLVCILPVETATKVESGSNLL